MRRCLAELKLGREQRRIAVLLLAGCSTAEVASRTARTPRHVKMQAYGMLYRLGRLPPDADGTAPVAQRPSRPPGAGGAELRLPDER